MKYKILYIYKKRTFRFRALFEWFKRNKLQIEGSILVRSFVFFPFIVWISILDSLFNSYELVINDGPAFFEKHL